jgi:malonate decarboxylase beta subunit
VGSGLSGGFLAHGLQANQILALDDVGVLIHAMGREAAARVTRQSLEELDRWANQIKPLSYSIRDWAQLGLCDELVSVSNADLPLEGDIVRVRSSLARAIGRARGGPSDLSNRRSSPGALLSRRATRDVYAQMSEEW